MKKFITTFLTIAMLAVSLPMLAGSASAQRRTVYNQGRYAREYRNQQRIYQDYQDYPEYYSYDYEEPSTYDKHRKAVNLAVGTGVGVGVGKGAPPL